MIRNSDSELHAEHENKNRTIRQVSNYGGYRLRQLGKAEQVMHRPLSAARSYELVTGRYAGILYGLMAGSLWERDELSF